MKDKSDNLKQPARKGDNEDQNDLNGYPEYPASDDIYNKFQEERDIDPEDITRIKQTSKIDEVNARNEKDLNDDISGSDLDIPDSGLDDDLVNAGIEDEENDYYSLGGDEHCDLEEDQGE